MKSFKSSHYKVITSEKFVELCKRIFLIEKNVKDNFFRLGGRNVLNLYDLPTNISGVLLLLTGMLFIKWKKHLKWKFTTMGFFSFYKLPRKPKFNARMALYFEA